MKTHTGNHPVEGHRLSLPGLGMIRPLAVCLLVLLVSGAEDVSHTA
jgi:hypothetical protein